MKMRSFRISDDDFTFIKSFGLGNATLGIKMLCNFCKKNGVIPTPAYMPDIPIKIKKEIKKSSTPTTLLVKDSQLIKKAYSDAYSNKYGSEPVWAAKENRLANTLIASVGLDLAVKLAEFYPVYIDPWHVKQRHPFSLLISQVAKVKTDYLNQKHLINASVFEKEFDKKVVDYSFDIKAQDLKQESELARMAYNIAAINDPELKDYDFDFELFMFENNIDPKSSYIEKRSQIEAITKRVDYDKNRLL
jgi:hypothetical protein